MRVQIEAADTTRFGILLTEGGRHVSALLSHDAGRWSLRYGDGDGLPPFTVDLLPGRTPWGSALNRACRMCELHLMRR